MEERLKKILAEAREEIRKATLEDRLEMLRVSILGKKGALTEILKSMREMDEETRKKVGALANEIKNILTEMIETKKRELENLSLNQTETDFDITYNRPHPVGSYHPITLVQKEIEKIFIGMGFKLSYGEESTTEYYNFEALNIPGDHPARDMQDTFWLSNGQLLRTHTSAQQIKMMEKYGAPLRLISPGRVFRNERIDASHENTFFQLEGMLIDRNVSISNLIFFMKELLSQVLHEEVEVRLRPGFFPFVEPGFELDMKCKICNGQGCKTCKNSGWIEMLPCGMIHPKVLEYGGVDPKKYTGFAFGLGLTRFAMMKYGVREIRELNSMDVRKLSQFN